MRRIGLLVVAVILGLCLLQVNQAMSAQGQQVSMDAEAAPKILNFVGEGEKSLGAVRYPQFTDMSGDNQGCINTLSALSGQYISGAPSFAQCLTTGAISIDSRYRKTGRILVSWNLRVVAEQPPVYKIWRNPPVNPWECHPWHGSVKQKFKGGSAYSRIVPVVNGKTVSVTSNTITMTIPDAGTGTDVNVMDPTHTGSIIITPSMFSNGELPASITFNLQWKNDTSLKLISRDKMRSIVVTVSRN